MTLVLAVDELTHAWDGAGECSEERGVAVHGAITFKRVDKLVFQDEVTTRAKPVDDSAVGDTIVVEVEYRARCVYFELAVDAPKRSRPHLHEAVVACRIVGTLRQIA